MGDTFGGRTKRRKDRRVGPGDDLVASQVNDVDMRRVREAERLILHEEEMFGVWTRNVMGKLIPLAKAEVQL